MILTEKQFRALGHLLRLMDRVGVRVHIETLTVSTSLNLPGAYNDYHSVPSDYNEMFVYRVTCNRRLFSETND